MSFTAAAAGFSELPTIPPGNPRLITVDAENVLTAYGDPTIRYEAMCQLTRWQNRIDMDVAIATNNHDYEYVDSLHQQLRALNIPVFSGLEYANKKTSPEMFLAAASAFEVEPIDCIHVDDQWLSFRGAKMAGFGRGVLVKPYGSTEHKGVKLGRLLDAPIRKTILAVQLVGDFRASGIDA